MTAARRAAEREKRIWNLLKTLGQNRVFKHDGTRSPAPVKSFAARQMQRRNNLRVWGLLITPVWDSNRADPLVHKRHALTLPHQKKPFINHVAYVTNSALQAFQNALPGEGPCLARQSRAVRAASLPPRLWRRLSRGAVRMNAHPTDLLFALAHQLLKFPPLPFAHARAFLRDLFAFQHPADAVETLGRQVGPAHA